MQVLNFPKYTFRFKSKENNILVFDEIRRKFVKLLPEEWVRQHCIHYLIKNKGYPAGLMLVEKQYKRNGLQKRIDLAVCDLNGNVELLVECKAPNVEISQFVFDQIARYNLEFQAKYLMVTNGRKHFYCRMDYKQKTYVFLPDLPDFKTY
jgi:hypothetical protein